MTSPPMSGHSHLSIGEVLSLLQEEFPDVTISKIRFLESQGLLDPERTPSGYRKFYEADIDQLRWILTQQKENFLPLKVIKDRLEARDDGDSPDADPAADGESVPIWMADAARAAAARTAPARPSLFDREPVAEPVAPQAETPAEPATPAKSPPPPTAAAAAPPDPPTPAARPAPERRAATPLDVGPTSVSLTFSELASASGLSEDQLRELESFGLLEGRSVGSEQFYDGDALVIAQKSAGFIAKGIEPRHLRMFKVAAEREAGFLEQVVMPMVKQRNPAAKEQAIATLGELASLGQSLRAALLRHALRDHLS